MNPASEASEELRIAIMQRDIAHAALQIVADRLAAAERLGVALERELAELIAMKSATEIKPEER